MRLWRNSIVAMLLLGLAVMPACRKKKQPVAEEEAGAEPEAEVAVKAEKGENRLPKVQTLVIAPIEPRVTDDLKVKADATDADGDTVTYTYQWYINGKQILGEISDTLRAGRAVHGDKVEVEATPFDGKDTGKVRKSSSVTIANSPPKLASSVSSGVSLDGFRMQVTDADNDPITFRLEGAPPNMTVDADGTLRWRSQASDKAGEYNVTMIAEDGRGGSVTIKFPVQVTASQPAATTTGRVVSPGPGERAVVPLSSPPSETPAPRTRYPGQPVDGATPPPAP